MIEEKITIINKLGLHARAAAKFVGTATKYTCKVEIEKDGKKVDGKSIMSVLLLAAGKGSELTISVHGDDETEALEAIKELILNRFDEDE